MFKQKNQASKATIDPIVEARLDEALNASDQQFIAQSVKRLENEDVSLAWRSGLNEKVLAMSAEGKKRRKIALVWRPAAGLAMASALTFAVFTTLDRGAVDGSSTAVRPSIEAAAVDAHLSAFHREELGSVQLVSTSSSSTPNSIEWQESDLGAF